MTGVWLHGLGLDEMSEGRVINSVFTLRFVANRGVSLGLLHADSVSMRWALVALTAAIAVGVLVWMFREPNRQDQLGLGLVLGGAVGNILDRVRFGYVVDFADLHFGDWRPFLVFNVADAAITSRRAHLCSVSSGAAWAWRQAAGRGVLQWRILMRKLVSIAPGLGAFALLSGCAHGGREHARPDEFAVARQAPLVIPPDFSLAPPQPGAARANDISPNAQALDALFGGPAQRSASETTTLGQAGADIADPGIRSDAGDPGTNVVDKWLVTRTSDIAAYARRRRPGRPHHREVIPARMRAGFVSADT